MPVKAGNTLYSCLGIFLLVCVVSRADDAVAASRPERTLATDGVISLSRKDLEAGVPLAGQWEIYRGLLLYPEDFHSSQSLERNLVTVPGDWSDDSRSFPHVGCVTYRLIVLLPDGPSQVLGLFLRGVATSYRLFCNGVLFAEKRTGFRHYGAGTWHVCPTKRFPKCPG